MKCQYCQNECRDDALFCNVCGTRIVNTAVPASTTPAQQVFASTPMYFQDPPEVNNTNNFNAAHAQTQSPAPVFFEKQTPVQPAAPVFFEEQPAKPAAPASFEYKSAAQQSAPAFFEPLNDKPVVPAFSEPIIPEPITPSFFEPKAAAQTLKQEVKEQGTDTEMLASSYLDELLERTAALAESQSNISANKPAENASVDPLFEISQAEAPVFTMPWLDEEDSMPADEAAKIVPEYSASFAAYAENFKVTDESVNTTIQTEEKPEIEMNSEENMKNNETTPVMQTKLNPAHTMENENDKPLSTGKFMLLEFLKIPVLGWLVGFVLYLIWGFSKDSNTNLKNYSRSKLIWLLIKIALVILVFVVGLVALQPYIAEVIDGLENWMMTVA